MPRACSQGEEGGIRVSQTLTGVKVHFGGHRGLKRGLCGNLSVADIGLTAERPSELLRPVAVWAAALPCTSDVAKLDRRQFMRRRRWLGFLVFGR